MTRDPRAANPIRSEIDLDANGKQTGYLRLPHSVHRSAYGWIPIPIASIRNGDGPVMLIMAGNHGDEYEGQIIVSQLIREIQPQMVRGQLILLPMANFPAAEAGLRTSPLDEGNLNRTFPGNPAGTPTELIADYIEHTLLARADYLVDLHSGGSSLLYHGANMLAIEPRNADEDARASSVCSM
jgi:predicted deacylase